MYGIIRYNKYDIFPIVYYYLKNVFYFLEDYHRNQKVFDLKKLYIPN